MMRKRTLAKTVLALPAALRPAPAMSAELEEAWNAWRSGGVRIDGLLSHAFLKDYAWTIDFDAREYIFANK